MKEFEEAQKSFLDIIQIIHRRTYNIFHNYKEKKDITKELVELLDFEFDEMRVIEKDIKISESDTCNNNSL